MQHFVLLTLISGSTAIRVTSSSRRLGLRAQDAIELCGDGSDKLSDWFGGTEDCEDNPPPGFDPELGIAATQKQQASETFGRAYAEPPFRLYVCHEGSSVGGVLFSQKGARVFSKEELKDISGMLFRKELWPMRNTAFTQTRANVKSALAGLRGKQSKDTNVPYLWCLDGGGNLLLAPEIQYGKMYKHGDLTPGKLPWTRPDTNIVNASASAKCCCKNLPPTVVKEFDVVQDTCEYIRKGNLCCKVYPEGCPSMSHYIQMDDFESFCGTLPHEAQTQGSWRGVARAAGEVRFPDDLPPIVQDASSYSLTDRLRIPASLPAAEDEKDPAATLKAKFELSGELGTCAMRKLRRYWKQVLGEPWNEAVFGEVHFEKNQKKRTRLLDAADDALDKAFEAKRREA